MRTDIRVYSIAQCEEELGGDNLAFFFQSFSCPLNREVEDFLKNKALQSSRMSSSVTYLVCHAERKDLLGYFTLTAKAYSVKGAQLNSKNRRLVERFAEVDENGFFNAAVYLIAQIGKNYTIPESRRISGNDLLALAIEKFAIVKQSIGGKLVMVEREIDRPKLLNFYKTNGFKSWTTRRNAKDGIVYDQMFTILPT